MPAFYFVIGGRHYPGVVPAMPGFLYENYTLPRKSVQAGWGDIFDIFLSFARELMLAHLSANTASGTDDFCPDDYISRTSVKGCMAFLDVIIDSKKKLLSNVNYTLLANSFAMSSREVLGW